MFITSKQKYTKDLNKLFPQSRKDLVIQICKESHLFTTCFYYWYLKTILHRIYKNVFYFTFVGIKQHQLDASRFCSQDHWGHGSSSWLAQEIDFIPLNFCHAEARHLSCVTHWGLLDSLCKEGVWTRQNKYFSASTSFSPLTTEKELTVWDRYLMFNSVENHFKFRQVHCLNMLRWKKYTK